ncbi:unnamed protein product [Parascedosporium putredinis]|uniref:Autophagy-related protein 11 n=1 Tax=Parascedosporium putredinis TaxID=1442378 RepID=A0A9P1H4N8_9PEZI|nr:unnamed protein product [Parascedosporium putredinis]CAI7998450.1 unnamed protein product [Parascedosporium putredinis]
MSAWHELYKHRRGWALDVAQECSHMNVTIQERYQEIDAMVKCLDAAVANLEFSIKQIEPKYTELKKWVEPALSEHEQLASNWEAYLGLARAVPVSPQMVKFMTSKEVKPTRASLEDLVDLDTARKAGRLAPTSLRKFTGKAAELDKSAAQMYQSLQQLVNEFDALVGRSALLHSGESAQLQQDIEALAKKIDSDYQLILEYTLPKGILTKRTNEMSDLVQYATKSRNAIAAESIRLMRSITEVTSLHASVKSQITVLNQAEEDMTTFDYLRLIYQLPYMYASFVIEAVRRREWSDKVKSDSSTLANTMAVFQDEETKRRRKWQKMVGSTYGRDKFDATTLGLEVNLLGEEDAWPSMTKQDIETFIESLRTQNAEPTITEDVVKLLNELKSPTRQQSKRIKAFKNGSIHEAALDLNSEKKRGQLNEKDLLENMEALKREFVDERKSLESEIKRLQARLEDTEDEMENFGESREHEKASFDEKLLELQDEIDRLGKEKERDQCEALERQVKSLQEELEEATTSGEKAIASNQESLLALENVLRELSPQAAMPKSTEDLIKTVVAMASETMDKVKDAANRIASLVPELEQARSSAEAHRLEASEATSKLASKASALSQAHASLEEEKVIRQDVESNLTDARQQLEELRIQIADGETGSESLRKALEVQEQKASRLVEELAAKQSETGRVEEELHHFKERLQESQARALSLKRRADARGACQGLVAAHLYAKRPTVSPPRKAWLRSDARRFEHGRSKIPRAERASHMQNTTELSDPASPSTRRSITLPISASPDPTQLELLYWMNTNDEEAELERYQAFMENLGTFDIDLFSDTLFRRVKDMEHLARKFQRDARAYREKALVLQREAHEKIAYKNFKEGDLALFLPTRNQSSGAWACFNERVVDLSRSVQAQGDADSLTDEGNDNPFQLSDGLRWYLLDAHEDKHGAPSTPGLGKSTVAANKVEAVADMRARSATKGKDKQRLSQHSIEGHELKENVAVYDRGRRATERHAVSERDELTSGRRVGDDLRQESAPGPARHD